MSFKNILFHESVRTLGKLEASLVSLKMPQWKRASSLFRGEHLVFLVRKAAAWGFSEVTVGTSQTCCCCLRKSSLDHGATDLSGFLSSQLLGSPHLGLVEQGFSQCL